MDGMCHSDFYIEALTPSTSECNLTGDRVFKQASEYK